MLYIGSFFYVSNPSQRGALHVQLRAAAVLALRSIRTGVVVYGAPYRMENPRLANRSSRGNIEWNE